MDRRQLIQYLLFSFFLFWSVLMCILFFFNPVVFCTLKLNARLFTSNGNNNVIKLNVEGW